MPASAKKKKQIKRNAGIAQPLLNHEDIARLAYSYWDARQNVSPEADWLRAEAELRARMAISESSERE